MEGRKKNNKRQGRKLISGCDFAALENVRLPILVMYVCMLSRVQLFETPWTVACQPPLSMELSRQGYESGLPFPPPEDLPDPGIEPKSTVSAALAGRLFTTEPPGKPYPHYKS